jgi:carotenoid cleavage dioxygenase-like enzyme
VFTEAGGSQRLVGFSIGEALSDALITVWEYDEGFRCLHKIKRTLPGAAFGFFHDIAVTDNHYVLLQVAARVGLARLAFALPTRGAAAIASL